MFRRPIIAVVLLLLMAFSVFKFSGEHADLARFQTPLQQGPRSISISELRVPTSPPSETKRTAPSSTVRRSGEIPLPPGIESKLSLSESYALLSTDRRNFRSFVDPNGIFRSYRPEVILGKFKNDKVVYAFKVKAGTERELQKKLAHSPEIAFAELDMVMARQFQPNDQELPSQWHHQTIHSTNAWSLTLGNSSVKLAILDTPFQMDHPDLVGQAIPGWDMVGEGPVTSAPGFYHSTIGAGLAGAAINNFIGVAGAVNCQLMPINIGDFPTLSDMYKAVVWAADHAVRVVNISWDGCFSSVINEGGVYLKSKTGGLLFMAGVNGNNHFLNYPNQPDIYAVSMTDTNDVTRSAYGAHIDFAAPGFQIYSTTTNSGYEIDSGSSYATPLAAGMAAFVMSVNPELNPDQIIEVLKSGTLDVGPLGVDQYYGWGRLDLGKIARAAFSTLSISHIAALPDFTIQAQYLPGAEYSFLRSEQPGSSAWEPVAQYTIETNGSSLFFKDLSINPVSRFYQIQIRLR